MGDEKKVDRPDWIPESEWNELSDKEKALVGKGYARGAAKKERELKLLQDKEKELLQQLTDTEGQNKLTKEQFEKARARLDELETASMTAEQKFQRELTKANQDWERKHQASEKRADQWKTRHLDSLRDAAIVAVSNQLDAWNPEQIVEMFRRRVQVVEQKDDNGDVVDFVPQIEIKDEKTGEKKTVSVKDGLTILLKNHPNLIKGKVLKGPGATFESYHDSESGETLTRENLADPAFVNDPKNAPLIEKWQRGQLPLKKTA